MATDKNLSVNDSGSHVLRYTHSSDFSRKPTGVSAVPQQRLPNVALVSVTYTYIGTMFWVQGVAVEFDQKMAQSRTDHAQVT